MQIVDDTTETMVALTAAGMKRGAVTGALEVDERAPSASLTRLRWAIVAVLAVAMTLLVMRLAFVSGLVRRITIDGPSMAPALVGRHFHVTCDDCGFPFDCDADHVPAEGQAACPNCGFMRNELARATLLPAERVMIDRWPLWGRTPGRGECVALVSPGGAGLAVKRVAALPGQTWGIRDGDLYAGGQIVRKSLASRRATQILVHDNVYQPETARLPPRWRPASETSQWAGTANGFRRRAAPDRNGAFDWLQYEHWQCTADPLSRGVRAPVTDNDSFNQGETRRSLNPVHDVWLTCRVHFDKQGRLALAAADGDRRYQVAIDPQTGVVELTSAGRSLAQRRLERHLSRITINVEFGLCDQQVFLLLDGRSILAYCYERAGRGHNELHPLAIGASGGGLDISELRVWRDIYYLDPQGLARDWQAPLPLKQSEIAVVGDNQPVSIDSRQWGPISRPAAIGHVSRLFTGPPRVE